jgi:uncharacterized protein (UPF0333 family)
MDELLRALPAILIVLCIIGAFVLASRVRNRTVSAIEAQTKMMEVQLASTARLEELRRREVDALERIVVALESKKDSGG